MNTTVSRKYASRSLLSCAMLTLAVAIGCGDDSTSPNTAEFGHYTLVSVNGQSLPFTMANTALGTVVVQSGSIDLAAGTAASGNKSTYLAGVAGSRAGQGSAQLLTDNGTYVLTGTTVTFSSALVSGVQYVGAVSNNALTLTLPGALFGTTGTISLQLQR